MERVKVYGDGGCPERSGRGLFATALMARLPNLPVEEEGRLSDPRLRENFIERVFAYRRLQDLFAGRWTAGRLVALPHRAQDVAARALDDGVPGARPAGRAAARCRSRDLRDAVRDRCSCRRWRGSRRRRGTPTS